MKKIHITEAQLKYCAQKLKEAYTVDATQELEQTGNNAKRAADNIMAKNPNLKSDASRGEANISFDPNALSEGLNEKGESEDYHAVMEGKIFTKREIKEARLENLKKSCKVIKKKDI